LINLLTNAIKFSNEDDVVNVIVKTKVIGKNKKMVSISVIDFGLGISEAD